MAIGILGIAQGAGRLAGKLFKVAQNARDRKVEKAAQRLVDAREKQKEIFAFGTPGIIGQNKPVDTLKKPAFISSLGSLINPDAGTQAVSGAANALQEIKGGAVAPRNAQEVAEEVSGGRGMGFDPKWLLYLLGLVILFPFIKRLIR